MNDPTTACKPAFERWDRPLAYICPVCADRHGTPAAPLLAFNGEHSLVCPKGHCFDISSGGYVNLLLPQHKNVKDPGDSREMVRARSEFLGSGAYEPLRNALCAAARELCADIPSPAAADCGCGELYYTQELYRTLCEGGRSAALYALDISKQALTVGRARARDGIFTAVASSFRLPIADGALDMAAVVFAPMCTGELLRVLKRGGYVIEAIPAREHLFGLKSLLYERPYYNEVKPYETEGFEFLGKREVSCEINLDSQQLLNALFTMTPYYYKTSPADAAALYSYFGTHGRFCDTAAFEVLMYRKK